MCYLLFPLIAIADPEPMKYRAEAYRTYQSIEIDGEFNEEDWQNARSITRLIQYEPVEGELISQPTEIRILYDAKEIYFGFTCFDTDISKMVANEMRRDGSGQDGLRENDHVSILLDTYNDRRNGFFFRVNPLGAMEDMALINSGESRNQAWDAVWTCRTKINDNHWTAEIGIPFSQLRFSKRDEMTWGLNLGRSLMRNQEDATWGTAFQGAWVLCEISHRCHRRFGRFERNYSSSESGAAALYFAGGESYRRREYNRWSIRHRLGPQVRYYLQSHRGYDT